MQEDEKLNLAILLAVQSRTANAAAGAIEIPGWSFDAVLEHIVILHDRGLIEATFMPDGSGSRRIRDAFVEKITVAGRDYLRRETDRLARKAANAEPYPVLQR